MKCEKSPGQVRVLMGELSKYYMKYLSLHSNTGVAPMLQPGVGHK